MRTALDFAPLFRSSIGFDRLLNLLESANRAEPAETWPPYNILRTGDESYQIVMAIPGFGQDEIEVVQHENALVVSGKRSGESSGQFLHRGLATGEFRRQFELADHVTVKGADLVNGLLAIDLQREVPEALKPRKIAIASTIGQGGTAQAKIGSRNAA